MEILTGIALVVLIFMGIGSIGKGNGTGSPVGDYDGKWSPIKCPKYGCMYVSMMKSNCDWNWECDE